MTLKLQNLHKKFGKTRALRGVSFEVTQGEIAAVLGPSGCGKSTLLSVIAGLELPDQGEIYWEGDNLANIPSHRRGFGLMFQDFMLFPHKNVYHNVAFGLQMAKLEKPGIEARVAETLELVGLPGFGDRDVNQLSGGEQQRVALARSLAPKPRLLMLDEPLGSLDRALRERLLSDLHTILKESVQTTLYITHDQEEAYVIADRIVVMDAGKVAQIGSPHTIYTQPASLFVARFLGLSNLFPGEVHEVGGKKVLETPIGMLPAPDGFAGRVTVLLRPDAVHLDGNGEFKLQGKLLERTFRGVTSHLEVEVNGERLTFEILSSVVLPKVGEMISLSFDPKEAVQLID
ncbi:MAG: ABC transporter ATP-binding protein [Chloroflexi bacterium]|nr:ABC transporter ATP-binding protein [Chloroflexota bacterium]